MERRQDDQERRADHLSLKGSVDRTRARRESGGDRAEPDHPGRQSRVVPAGGRRGALLPRPPHPRRLPPPPPALSMVCITPPPASNLSLESRRPAEAGPFVRGSYPRS